jgi:hypothetical protein
MARRLLGSTLVVLMMVACGGGDDSTGIEGRWDGGVDWGEVIINGLEGTYTSTFGEDPGTIELTELSETEYTGTWGEGTDRFGTLEIRLDSSNVIVGDWTADPASAIAGSSGGQLRWIRD